MTPESASPVPQQFVERLAKAFSAFLVAVRAAIQEGIANPAISSSQSFLALQTQALPLLEQENNTVQQAWARYLIGETRTILAVAAEERHLAKKLDGYFFGFAGPERAQAIDQLMTSVVVAAYQVCAAAGIP